MFCIVVILLAILGAAVGGDSTCEDPSTVVGEQEVIIYGRKESSKWVTTILSQFETEGSPESPNLVFGQKVLKCNGKEIVHIKAVLREQGETKIISATPKSVLHFQTYGGKNIRVTNNGMTVSRVNVIDGSNAGILTNRPLKDDELFEVRLDKCFSNFSSNIGIGITNNTPSTITYGDWFRSGATTLYNNNLYGNHPKSNYGPNLRNLKDGARVGVQRKKNGDLHFFVDGTDLGIAATGIASPVYGVFDLYGDCVEASIVKN